MNKLSKSLSINVDTVPIVLLPEAKTAIGGRANKQKKSMSQSVSKYAVLYIE